MDSVSKFNGLSELYSHYRPGYSESGIDYVFEKCGKEITRVADIGAGTGKLSLPFLNRGCEVYAIDPNKEMLKQACKDIGENKHFHTISAFAEETTLDDYCIDLIVIGQAFHWFDAKLFKKEAKRILKQDAYVAIFYNNGDKTSELITKIDELSRKYCPNYKGSSGGLENQEELFKRFFSKYEKVVFPNNYCLSLEEFLGLNFSASYAPKQGEEQYEVYLQQLIRIFKLFSDGEKIRMPNNTILRIGKL